MSFQPAPECAEAVIQGLYGSKPIANVLNFWKPGGYIQADIDALAEAIDLAVQTNYKATFTNSVTYTGTLVRGLAELIDLFAFTDANAGAGGASGSAALPGNVSLCVGMTTGATGRSARGRFYAWPTEVDNTAAGENFQTTYVDDVEAFLVECKSAALDEGWHLIVLSRVSEGVEREEATHRDVTSIAARNTLIDSMKRRLVKGH